MATIEATGPGLFTRVVWEHLKANKEKGGGEGGTSSLLLAPPQWFYPLPNNSSASFSGRSWQADSQDREDEEEEAAAADPRESLRASTVVIPGVTCAIHHWACSWQKD